VTTKVDPDQPGNWIDIIFESLAGQIERSVDGVERWVSGREQLPGSNDSGDWPDYAESPTRNWRWE
jgi:hypothetical protein